MPNRVKRLEAIIHQHHLAVSPPLVVKKLPPKSTKLQNNKSVVCLLVFVHWCKCVSVCTLSTPLLQNRIMSFIMISYCYQWYEFSSCFPTYSLAYNCVPLVPQ